MQCKPNINAHLKILLFLIVKHAVAIALKVGVGYLLAELAADAFIVLSALEAAGAISALSLKPLLDGFYHFFVFI